MLVRVRLPRGVAAGRHKRRIGPLTFMMAGLLRMAAVSCLMLALWRLTSDMGWTGAFFIEVGLFSHWQVWLAITIALGLLSFRLARYALPIEPVAAGATETQPETQPEKPELTRRIVSR